jgi:transcriptional regulator with XRE-family HTH domain
MLDRIQKILQVKKLTPSAFADKIGVPRSTISHVLSGRNNPSLEFVQKVLDSFPDIRTEWMVRGEGNMLRHSNTLFPEDDDTVAAVPSKEPDAPSPPAPETMASTKSLENADIPGEDSGSEEILKSEAFKEVAEKPDEPDNVSEKTNKGVVSVDKKLRKTTRVLMFYSDGTFSEYYPSA